MGSLRRDPFLPREAWYNAQFGTWFSLVQLSIFTSYFLHKLKKPKRQKFKLPNDISVRLVSKFCTQRVGLSCANFVVSSSFKYSWPSGNFAYSASVWNCSLYILKAFFFFCLRVPESFPFWFRGHFSCIRHLWSSQPNSFCPMFIYLFFSSILCKHCAFVECSRI